jgi:hypothetical protein
MNRIHTYSGALILCLAAPACTIDKNLLGDETGETASSATGSASAPTTGATSDLTTGATSDPTTGMTGPSMTGATDGDTGEPNTGDTSGTGAGDSETTEDVPAECAIDTEVPSLFLSLFFSTGVIAVDEVCVLTGVTVDESQLLSFDCPQHAAMFPGVPVEFELESGPLPAGLAVGASLAVYYQVGDHEGFMKTARPELLFLRDDEALVYASIRGYFLRDEDFTAVAEKAQPLAVALVPGPCEHVPTGWEGGDGTGCVAEAVSQIEVTGDAAVVIGEGLVAPVQAGARSYTADVREARHGEDCVDKAEQFHYQLALALQP